MKTYNLEKSLKTLCFQQQNHRGSRASQPMDGSAKSSLHFLSLKEIRSQSLEFQRIINENPEDKDHGLFSAKGFSSSIKAYNLSMKKHERKVKHF